MLDNLKTCPRCDGKGWTSWNGHICRICWGTGNVRQSVHRCEALAGPIPGSLIEEYRQPRRCGNLTTVQHRGKWVCWLHNPEGDYAGYRKAVKAHRARKPRPIKDGSTVAWRRQRARMKAAVEGERHA